MSEHAATAATAALGLIQPDHHQQGFQDRSPEGEGREGAQQERPVESAAVSSGGYLHVALLVMIAVVVLAWIAGLLYFAAWATSSIAGLF